MSRNAQFLAKTLIVWTCLGVAWPAMSSQDTPARPSDGSNVIAQPRIYRWPPNDLDGLQRWLKSNASLLERGDACSRGFYWSDKQNKFSTSNYELASFVVIPDDDEITYTVHESESGVDVRVGIKFQLVNKAVSEIRVALAFEGDPEDVFNEVSRAEARSMRDNTWKLLEGTKPIQSGNRVYRFHLICENGKTALAPFKKHK